MTSCGDSIEQRLCLMDDVMLMIHCFDELGNANESSKENFGSDISVVGTEPNTDDDLKSSVSSLTY